MKREIEISKISESSILFYLMVICAIAMGFIGFQLGTTHGYVYKEDPVFWIIYETSLLLLLIFLLIITKKYNDYCKSQKQRKIIEEKEEWAYAMYYAKQIEPSITDDLIDILVERAQETYSSEKEDVIDIKSRIQKQRMKAEHIKEVFNELFEEEEKEESE